MALSLTKTPNPKDAANKSNLPEVTMEWVNSTKEDKQIFEITLQTNFEFQDSDSVRLQFFDAEATLVLIKVYLKSQFQDLNKFL